MKKTTGWKSKIKTALRLHGFEPHHGAWREFFKCGGIAKRNYKLFRFRKTEAGEWVVDVSCILPDFDRWANSTEQYAVPLALFAIQFNVAQLKGTP